MTEVAQINEFYEQLKELKNRIAKRKTKTISTQEFKKEVTETYETWKVKIHPILQELNTGSQALSLIDSHFESIFRASQQRVAEVSELKTKLREMTAGFFKHIVVPLSKKSLGLKPSVQNLLKDIVDEDERNYLKEALDCASIDARRAATVLGWIGAMWNLYSKIEAKSFSLFNECYEKRYLRRIRRKVKTVKKIEDFEYYQDREILLVSEDVGVLGRSERRILEKCLDLRNICAHPSKYTPTPSEVSLFFERIVNILLSK